jgi:hypothetical protein
VVGKIRKTMRTVNPAFSSTGEVERRAITLCVRLGFSGSILPEDFRGGELSD